MVEAPVIGKIKAGLPNAEEAFSQLKAFNATRPQAALLVFNIQKQKNLGMMIRSAAAFGIEEIFAVESNSKKKPLTFGSQGTEKK